MFYVFGNIHYVIPRGPSGSKCSLVGPGVNFYALNYLVCGWYIAFVKQNFLSFSFIDCKYILVFFVQHLHSVESLIYVFIFYFE